MLGLTSWLREQWGIYSPLGITNWQGWESFSLLLSWPVGFSCIRLVLGLLQEIGDSSSGVGSHQRNPLDCGYLYARECGRQGFHTPGHENKFLPTTLISQKASCGKSCCSWQAQETVCSLFFLLSLFSR